MRKIDKITVHCSATKPSQKHDVDSIRKMHLNRGWSDIGYHGVITRDGEYQEGRPIERNGAGVKGHNTGAIHICMIGGVDENNKSVDNFTEIQFEALRYMITHFTSKYGVKEENILGHRDYSPDLNGDGKITSNEFIKMCPCFDVQKKLQEWKV